MQIIVIEISFRTNNNIAKILNKVDLATLFLYFCISNKKKRVMKQLLRYFLTIAFVVSLTGVYAQSQTWRAMYKVKKKDTLFGIAKKHDVTIPELMEVNPEMKLEGYSLKKGDYIYIPYAKNGKTITPAPVASVQKPEKHSIDVRNRAINVGIMLPLHNIDGDGKRMVEYYRGLLMACDSLKAEGISTNVSAWNVAIDTDINTILQDAKAKECDIIFGPLYTKQVKALSNFCKANHISMVIPFSISGNDVASNPKIFQVYQDTNVFNEKSINAFVERFPNHHAVFVDCNDTTSKKGVFTFTLRKRLEERGLEYSITNLKSSEVSFAKAFSSTQPNVVILNTGRSPELNVALAKLDGLKANNPSLSVSLFGYKEWLLYTKVYLNYFHKYNAYIPTVFYYNPLEAKTRNLENNFRRWFKTDLQYALPRFAITGYDQANFFTWTAFLWAEL